MVDLNCQFPCWNHYERLCGSKGGVKVGNQRDAKRCSLTGPRLGLANNIVASCYYRNNSLLDRGWFTISDIGQSPSHEARYGKSTEVRRLNLIGSLLLLLPFAVIAIWSSQNFVLNSFRIGEVSPDPGGLPARYILKAMISIGFTLILLQGLAMMFRSFDQFMHSGEDHTAAAKNAHSGERESAKEDMV